MPDLRPRYIDRRAKRQTPVGSGRERSAPPFFRTAIVAVLLVSSAGCSGVGLPTAALPDPTTTGSITPITPTATESVTPSDWAVVLQAIAAAPDTSGSVPWQNPQTGSSGTVVAEANQPVSNGVCRPFTATVNDLRGVRRYRGQACRAQGADWQLTRVVAEDSALL